MHVLAHIFAVTARSRREIALCDVLWRTLTQDYEFFLFFLNLSAVRKNSTSEKFESDVFAAVAVVPDAKAP